MATRLYHGTSTAAGPTWTPSANWEKTNQAGGRRDFLTAKANQATGAGGSFGGTGSNPNDSYSQGFISPPLAGAQTISGTVKGQMFARGASGNFRSQLIIRVLSRDGTTVRGTLVDQSTGAESSTWSTTAAVNRKFPLAAISPVTVTTVNAQDGDRIVAEYGARIHNTTTTTTNNFLRWGNPTSSDLAENETDTDNGLRASWLEFSANLVFGNLGGDIGLTATLTGAGTKQGSGAGTLSATATLTSAGTKKTNGTGALTLTPSFARAGTKATTGTGSLTPSLTLARTATKQGAGTGSLTLSASFAAAASATHAGTGALSLSASFARAGTKATGAAGSLTASISLTSTGEVEQAGASSLSLPVSLAADGFKASTSAPALALVLGFSATGQGNTEAHAGSGTLTLTLTLKAKGRRSVRPSIRYMRIVALPETPTEPKLELEAHDGFGVMMLRATLTAGEGTKASAGMGRLLILPMTWHWFGWADGWGADVAELRRRQQSLLIEGLA